MTHIPVHAGAPTRCPPALFDDPVAERARRFLEPVLTRASDAARVGPEAERWVNLVYLTHKVLQTRPHAERRVGAAHIWPMQLRTVRDLIGATPETPERALLLDLLEALDEEAQQQPASRQWIEARRAYADWLEESGHLAEALGLHALTTGRAWASASAAEAVRVALTVARLYRKLARWVAADRAYGIARGLAEQIGARDCVCRAELGAALALVQRGNLPEAHRRLVSLHGRMAEAPATLRCEVAQDFGVVLERIGQPEAALARFLEALALAPDRATILRTLGNIGIALAKLGHWTTALSVQDLVRTRATNWVLRANAEIETLEPLSRRDAAEFHRRAEQLLQQVPRMAPSMRVDCRFNIARGLAYLQERDRASALLTEALADAATNGLHQWYFRIESSCTQILDVPAPPTPEDPVPTAPLDRLLAGVKAFTASIRGELPEVVLSTDC